MVAVGRRLGVARLLLEGGLEVLVAHVAAADQVLGPVGDVDLAVGQGQHPLGLPRDQLGVEELGVDAVLLQVLEDVPVLGAVVAVDAGRVDQDLGVEGAALRLGLLHLRDEGLGQLAAGLVVVPDEGLDVERGLGALEGAEDGLEGILGPHVVGHLVVAGGVAQQELVEGHLRALGGLLGRLLGLGLVGPLERIDQALAVRDGAIRDVRHAESPKCDE
ncbi:hypothetical protein D3C86_1354090 [compost metagenome]